MCSRKSLRLTLLGRGGAGKTSAASTILQQELDLDTTESPRSVKRCGERDFTFDFYNLSIVDTPDWLNATMSDHDVVEDIVRCCSLSAPGPHAFLLVVPLTEPSQEDLRWIKIIQEIFGVGALNYILILFTHSDKVTGRVEKLIDNDNEFLRDLVVTCGNRYHEFDNKSADSGPQVKTMLRKVLNLVRGNGSKFYCGHSRTNVLMPTMEIEILIEAVTTMRRGQREDYRSKGLFSFHQYAVVKQERVEETGRENGWPCQDMVKKDAFNGSHDTKCRDRVKGQVGEDEMNQIQDEMVKGDNKASEEPRIKKQKKRKILHGEGGSEGHSKDKDTECAKGGTRSGAVVVQQPGPSYLHTPDQKQKAQRQVSISPLKMQRKSHILNRDIFKHEMPVTCGDKTGVLNRDRFTKGGKCIMANQQWMTTSEFEKYGGKANCRNWKTSIKYKGTSLKKLMQDHILPSSNITVKFLKGKTVAKHRPKSRALTPTIRGCREMWLPAFIVQGENEKEDESEWRSERRCRKGNTTTFKVTCGALTGTIHKNRFASGTCGRCIRTEKSWMTPVEFVAAGSDQPKASWKRDIQWEGMPLHVLIKTKDFRLHSTPCDSEICCPRNEDDQRNDDDCFTCKREREDELVSCENCPRSFHLKCHVPVVENSTFRSGDKWMCTFCVFEHSKQWRNPDQFTSEEVLSKPMNGYLLECQYLLLFMYNAVEDQIDAVNPSSDATLYTALSKIPHRLDKVHAELCETIGQFVSKITPILTPNNVTSDVQTMGANLKDLFESEFQKTFNIQH